MELMGYLKGKGSLLRLLFRLKTSNHDSRRASSCVGDKEGGGDTEDGDNILFIGRLVGVTIL